MKYKEKVLVICSHPDDEVLGCGGSIKKYSKKYDIQCIYLSNGGTNRSDKSIKKKINEINNVKKILGIKKIYLGNFPDNRLDNVSLLDIIKYLEKIIFSFKPQFIFTHSSKDLNIDHQKCNQAVLTACRPTLKSKFIKKILFFEILSSTEWNFKSEMFTPEVFISLSNKEMIAKKNAMKRYSVELQNPPYPRSLNSIIDLAKLRGSHVGYKFAEAFELGYERISLNEKL